MKTRDTFEKMIHYCTCNQGPVIAHSGGIVTPTASSRVCNNQVVPLCKVCGGRSTLINGELGIARESGTSAVEYGSLKLKCPKLNSKEKNVEGLKQLQTALTTGVTVRKKRSLWGSLKRGGRGQDIRVLHKEDVAVSESEELGVTLLSRHFNDDVTRVPIKKRRYPLVQSPSSSCRLSSPEHLESKIPVKVHSALKQEQVKWIEHGQCVQDIMKMTQEFPQGDPGNVNIGICGNENQITEKRIEEPPTSLVSFLEEGLGSADFSGILILATAACTCNKESCADSLEDVEGRAESLSSEGTKSALLSMKNDMEIHCVENQQEVIPVTDTCIQEDDCEEQYDMLKNDDKKQESKGDQICINLNEAEVYVTGKESCQSTEMALGSNIHRGTCIYIESNDANAAGSSVQLFKNREKAAKGMLLRLDSGCLEDQSHWHLNTGMDAWENLPKNSAIGSEPYFSGELSVGSENKKNQRYSNRIWDPESKSATKELEHDMTGIGFQTDQGAHRPSSSGQPLTPEAHGDSKTQNCVDNELNSAPFLLQNPISDISVDTASIAAHEMICKFDSAVAGDETDECKVNATVTIDKNICKINGRVTVNESFYKVDDTVKVGDSVYRIDTFLAVDESICKVEAPMAVNESTYMVDVRMALNDGIYKVSAPPAMVDNSACQGEAPVMIDDCACGVEASVTIDGSACEADAPLTVVEGTCMVDVPVAVNDSIYEVSTPVAVDKSARQGKAPVLIDDCAHEVEAYVTIDGSASEIEASMAIDDSVYQVEASAAVSQTASSSDAPMAADENVCRAHDAVAVADTCTYIEKCESLEDRLEKHAAEMVAEDAYDGDYDYEGYESGTATEQKMEELSDDDSQYEDGRCREMMPCASGEDIVEEPESDTEHVDYGYSDCGDVDISIDTDDGFCQSLRAVSVCKGEEPMDSADIEYEDNWDDAQQGEVEGVISVCQVLDDSKLATQVGSDKQGNLPSNEATVEGTKLEDAYENVHHKNKVKSIDSLGENKEGVKNVGHPCSLDQHKTGNLRLMKCKTSLRQKYSGWDHLPGGFANAEKALQSVGDNCAMYGLGNGWTGHGGSDTCSRKGSMAARGFSSQVQRARPSNLGSGGDGVFSQGGRNGSSGTSSRFVSRGLEQGRTIRRGRSMHGKGRGGPCMGTCDGQWDVIEHQSSGCYGGPVVFGPRGPTNAAAVAAARVESSGFVVASDGTVVKPGSTGPALRGGMMMGKRSTAEIEGNMNFWMQRQDTGFSPPLRRRSVSHAIHSVTKSPSRSRTGCPRPWRFPKGRTCSRMELESESRRRGRSPLILRSEIRLDRQKSPARSRSLLPSSRRYCFPPQVSKWSLSMRDRAYRRPVVSARACPGRMSPPGVHRSSLIHSPGRSKHRVYSRPMYSGRSEFANDSKCSKHRGNDVGRSRQSDCHGSVYSTGAVEVDGDGRCFRHEDEDCFQASKSRANDAMESQVMKIPRADNKDTVNRAGNIFRRDRSRDGYNHHFRYKGDGRTWGNFKSSGNREGDDEVAPRQRRRS